MDIRYYLDSIVKHVDPKRSQNRKCVDRITNRLLGKQSSVLKARNFNTTLVCMQTIDEIYNGLIEKFTIQSDLQRAEEIKRLYSLLCDIDFEQFMKTGDCKPKLLYFLHKLSAGSASFVLPHEVAENRPVTSLMQFDDDPCNATVCIVDWQEVLFEGEEFSVRNFGTEDELDISFQEKDQQLPLPIETVHIEEKVADNAENDNSSPSSLQENETPSQPPVSSLADNLAVLKSCRKGARKPADLAYTEFSICNRALCAMSGATLGTDIFSSVFTTATPVLNHLSNGSLRTSVFHLSDSVSLSLQRTQFFYANANDFSSNASNEHLADIGMACGDFLQFLVDFSNDLSRSLQPVTLLNMNLETADIRHLITVFGTALLPLCNDDQKKEKSPQEKTQELIRFALSVQTKLHSCILGCDTSSASWLLFLWLSALRPLLRASIHHIFSSTTSSIDNSWFDASVTNNITIGQLNLDEVNKLLNSTYRYLTMLRQCREEAGDFLTQARLFALPNLFAHLITEMLDKEKNLTNSQSFLSPLVPLDDQYALPVDLVDQLSYHWMESLQAECKKASTQLFSIWEKSGLKSWLLAMRLVFLFQSIIQFDGRNKFVKKSTPALDLLAFHLPQDVWLEFVPAHIRRTMFASCDAPDASSATDADDLTEKYSSCKTVAQALELIEASNNQRQPLVLFPISLLLCPEVLSKYVRVHSFLSAFHVSKNWLSRSLLSTDPQSSCFGKFTVLRLAARSHQRSSAPVLLTPADRLLWLLRSAVFFALSALQQYFFTSIVCANCQRLEKELRSVDSADDLERIHNEIMSQIVTGCLFPVGHRTYQASLRHLIVLADMLSRQQVVPKNPVKHLPLIVMNQTGISAHNTTHLASDDSTLISGSEISWKLLATDTCQGIRFLADTLSRSASKTHSVTRCSLNNSLYDSEFSSSSVAWLANELQHASNIVSKQSKILLQLMHANK